MQACWITVPLQTKKSKLAVLPNEACQYDGFDHWPQPMDSDIPQRRKLEGVQAEVAPSVKNLTYIFVSYVQSSFILSLLE